MLLCSASVQVDHCNHETTVYGSSYGIEEIDHNHVWTDSPHGCLAPHSSTLSNSDGKAISIGHRFGQREEVFARSRNVADGAAKASLCCEASPRADACCSNQGCDSLPVVTAVFTVLAVLAVFAVLAV